MGFFDSVASFFATDAYAEERDSPDVGTESPADTNKYAAKHSQEIGQERTSATVKIADKGDRGSDNGKTDEGKNDDSSNDKEEGGADKADSDEEAAAISSNANEANANEAESKDDADEEDEEEDDDEEEEEEEEEEPEDIKPKLEEECAKTAACRPAKHHYDECVERVTAAAEAEDHKGPKEDCVEEFFHLTHCVAQCAAPKLFKSLA